MANAAFGWTNYVLSGTLAAGSSQSGLDTSQLQSPIGASSTAWQTAAGVTTSWFSVDMGSAKTIRVFGIFRTNLTTSATIRWRAGTDATFATNVYDSTTVSAGVVAGFGQSITQSPSDISVRYVRCDIADSSNSDGFLNVALAFVGPRWVPTVNVSWASSIGRQSGQQQVVTRGGQNYILPFWMQRAWQISMQGIKSTEVWTNLMPLDAAARTGNNVLFIPDIASSVMNQETVYGLCEPTSQLTFATTSIDARGWSATLGERL
jgi:hypothetical protein